MFFVPKQCIIQKIISDENSAGKYHDKLQLIVVKWDCILPKGKLMWIF